MSKTKIINTIALLSVIVGFVVMIGWYFDSATLTSILPIWTRMKSATAMCFIFSGIIIYFLNFNDFKRKARRQSVLLIFSTLIILIMSALFLGAVFDFQTGLEDISFISEHEIITPIFQGRPAVVTTFSFLLIAIVGIVSSFNDRSRKLFLFAGSTISIIGLIGVIGYLTGFNFLYYEIKGFSNAIALNTSILFSLLGVAIFLIGFEPWACQNYEK